MYNVFIRWRRRDEESRVARGSQERVGWLVQTPVRAAWENKSYQQVNILGSVYRFKFDRI